MSTPPPLSAPNEKTVVNTTPGGAGEYRCPWCSMRFFTGAEFQQHLRGHAAELQELIKQNEQLAISGQTESAKREESSPGRKEGTVLKPRLWKCGVCGYSTRTASHYKHHERTHSGEKPHRCQYCAKAFVQETSRLIHERTHTGEKPFTCDKCDKQFRCMQNLRAHEKTHSEERPYVCDVCHKGFKVRAYLAGHRRIHEAERRHSCDVCYKTFRQSSHLKRHKKTHQRQVHLRHKCLYCARKFMEKFNLRSHIEAVHMGSRLLLSANDSDANSMTEENLSISENSTVGQENEFSKSQLNALEKCHPTLAKTASTKSKSFELPDVRENLSDTEKILTMTSLQLGIRTDSENATEVESDEAMQCRDSRETYDVSPRSTSTKPSTGTLQRCTDSTRVHMPLNCVLFSPEPLKNLAARILVRLANDMQGPGEGSHNASDAGRFGAINCQVDGIDGDVSKKVNGVVESLDVCSQLEEKFYQTEKIASQIDHSSHSESLEDQTKTYVAYEDTKNDNRIMLNATDQVCRQNAKGHGDSEMAFSQTGVLPSTTKVLRRSQRLAGRLSGYGTMPSWEKTPGVCSKAVTTQALVDHGNSTVLSPRCLQNAAAIVADGDAVTEVATEASDKKEEGGTEQHSNDKKQVCTPPSNTRKHVCTPPSNGRKHVCTPPSNGKKHVCTPLGNGKKHMCTPPSNDKKHVCTPPSNGKKQVCTPPSNGKKHVCTPCGWFCFCKEAFRQHQGEHFKPYCRQCSRTFDSIFLLKEHLDKNHSEMSESLRVQANVKVGPEPGERLPARSDPVVIRKQTEDQDLCNNNTAKQPVTAPDKIHSDPDNTVTSHTQTVSVVGQEMSKKFIGINAQHETGSTLRDDVTRLARFSSKQKGGFQEDAGKDLDCSSAEESHRMHLSGYSDQEQVENSPLDLTTGDSPRSLKHDESFVPRIQAESSTDVLNNNLERDFQQVAKQFEYQCLVCEKLFPTEKTIRLHLASCKANKLKCSVCSLTLKSRRNLNVHMRTHSNSKPIQCDVCKRSFSQQSILNRHKMIHDDVRPFECDICARKFRQKNHLKEHLNTHTGLKPFSCFLCFSKFASRSNLGKHMKCHLTELENNFMCPVCNMEFIERSALMVHVRALECYKKIDLTQQ